MKRGAAALALLALVAVIGVALRRGGDEAAPPVDAGPPPGFDGGVAVHDAPSDAPSAPIAPAAAEIVAEPSAGPGAGSIEAAIEPAAPSTVTVVAQHDHHRDLFVLVAIDRSAPAAVEPAAEEPADEPAADEPSDEGEEDLPDEEPDEEPEEEPCVEEEGNDDAYCDCMRALGATPDEGWRLALGQPVVRFEVVLLSRRDDGYRALARHEVTAPLLLDADWADPAELRVNDLDDDGRPEVTAIFSFAVPDCDTFDDVVGTLGVILDGADLHEEAVFSRVLVRSGGDSDVNGESRETVWRVASDDAGRPELRVRETWHTSESDPPDFDSREAGGDRSVVCPYDAAADRFVCPEPIGTALFEQALPAR